MRWIVVLVLALAAGCFPPAGGAQQPNQEQAARINQLEQRVTALEQYIRQMYDVLSANGSLAAPQNGGASQNGGSAPTPPPTAPH